MENRNTPVATSDDDDNKIKDAAQGNDHGGGSTLELPNNSQDDKGDDFNGSSTMNLFASETASNSENEIGGMEDVGSDVDDMNDSNVNSGNEDGTDALGFGKADLAQITQHYEKQIADYDRIEQEMGERIQELTDSVILLQNQNINKEKQIEKLERKLETAHGDLVDYKVLIERHNNLSQQYKDILSRYDELKKEDKLLQYANNNINNNRNLETRLTSFNAQINNLKNDKLNVNNDYDIPIIETLEENMGNRLNSVKNDCQIDIDSMTINKFENLNAQYRKEILINKLNNEKNENEKEMQILKQKIQVLHNNNNSSNNTSNKESTQSSQLIAEKEEELLKMKQRQKQILIELKNTQRELNVANQEATHYKREIEKMTQFQEYMKDLESSIAKLNNNDNLLTSNDEKIMTQQFIYNTIDIAFKKNEKLLKELERNNMTTTTVTTAAEAPTKTEYLQLLLKTLELQSKHKESLNKFINEIKPKTFITPLTDNITAMINENHIIVSVVSAWVAFLMSIFIGIAGIFDGYDSFVCGNNSLFIQFCIILVFVIVLIYLLFNESICENYKTMANKSTEIGQTIEEFIVFKAKKRYSFKMFICDNIKNVFVSLFIYLVLCIYISPDLVECIIGSQWKNGLTLLLFFIGIGYLMIKTNEKAREMQEKLRKIKTESKKENDMALAKMHSLNSTNNINDNVEKAMKPTNEEQIALCIINHNSSTKSIDSKINEEERIVRNETNLPISIKQTSSNVDCNDNININIDSKIMNENKNDANGMLAIVDDNKDDFEAIDNNNVNASNNNHNNNNNNSLITVDIGEFRNSIMDLFNQYVANNINDNQSNNNAT